MSIKVVAEYAFEVVPTFEDALQAAKVFEENGYGVSTFEILDEYAVWCQVDKADL